MIHRGRQTADIGLDGKVMFLIGMRVNHLWQVWKWVPVLLAMPRMLLELRQHPDLGLVGVPRTYLSGRVVMVVQHWESFEKLDEYARRPDLVHLPAWRRFNRRVRDNGSVGIFHETILLSDPVVETFYANMPPHGLGAVAGIVPAGRRGQTAPERLGLTSEDTPPEAPY